MYIIVHAYIDIDIDIDIDIGEIMNRQQRFYLAMQAGLQKIGVSDNSGALASIYPQKLQTKYGKLLIKVEDEKNSQTSKLYTCYCCFEDKDRVKNELGNIQFNRYSGKWNFHIPVKNNDPVTVAASILGSIIPIASREVSNAITENQEDQEDKMPVKTKNRIKCRMIKHRLTKSGLSDNGAKYLSDKSVSFHRDKLNTATIEEVIVKSTDMIAACVTIDGKSWTVELTAALKKIMNS